MPIHQNHGHSCTMSKFKMSNGTEGMLRGQAPDAFQKVDPSMPRRSKHDTEFERMPVKPQKSHANSTGFTSQCAGLATDGVMEQAITDRLNQTMAGGIEDGWNARLELEAEEAKANKEVTQADIDAMEDKKQLLNDDDDDLEALRARRRQQMKDAHDKRLKYQALGHGSYDEIEEEVFLKTVCASPRCVVHFLSQAIREVQGHRHASEKVRKEILWHKICETRCRKGALFLWRSFRSKRCHAL